MLLVPSFDPSNITINDKIQYVFNNLEHYNQLIGAVNPAAYISFILPGFTEDKEELNISLVTPNLFTPELVKDFYDKELSVHINYFGNIEELKEKLYLYDHDFILNQKMLSPAWNIVVYVPLHSIDTRVDKSKFNIEYGLTLIGTEINLMNIQKYSEQGIKKFNLHFLDLPKAFTYTEVKKPLLKELSTKFPDNNFLICAKDARTLDLPKNFQSVVGSIFWKELIH